jgi:hypothetical protein
MKLFLGRRSHSFRKTSIVALVASTLTFVMLGATPAFAWHVNTFNTTVGASTSVVGTGVYDTAFLSLSNNGPLFGSITFKAYTGSCDANGNPTGTLKFTSVVPVTAAASTGGATYTSATWTTTGAAAGSYVWVATYGGGGYPSATASCEPFTLTPPVTHGVPEFSAGIPLLLGLALPALFLFRSRLAPRTN